MESFLLLSQDQYLLGGTCAVQSAVPLLAAKIAPPAASKKSVLRALTRDSLDLVNVLTHLRCKHLRCLYGARD